MKRTKVFAVLAAIVATGAAALAFAPGASAASWHVYQGDMFAGHAYGLQVPAGAQSVEFLFEGGEGGAAAIAVFTPAGDKLGHFALSPALAAASVANPKAGQYVVYVYDVQDGALTVRVDSEREPALDLRTIPLVREETKIGTFENGPLDQTITTELKREPVFLTLLYEGSATGLDATVGGERGAIVTIADETASAFSPGVWTTMKGERTFNGANIAGKIYTVEAHAEQFEGRMVLTTLALDLRPKPTATAPHLPPMDHPAPPQPPATEVPAHAPGTFALVVGEAVAFQASAGLLQLIDPALLERAAEKEEDEESHGWGGGHHTYAGHTTLSLYAPDDTLLAIIELDENEPVAQIELPVDGEYVAFTHHASDDVVLAKLGGSDAAPAVRHLALAVEEFDLDVANLFGPETEAAQIELANVPLMLCLSLDGLGALAQAELANEKGPVASTDEVVVAGTPFMTASAAIWHENFAKGLHTLTVDGVFEGVVHIESLHYVRAAEHDHEHEEAHAEHGGHDAPESAPPAPGAPPAPPAAPIAPLAPIVVPELPL